MCVNRFRTPCYLQCVCVPNPIKLCFGDELPSWLSLVFPKRLMHKCGGGEGASQIGRVRFAYRDSKANGLPELGRVWEWTRVKMDKCCFPVEHAWPHLFELGCVFASGFLHSAVAVSTACGLLSAAAFGLSAVLVLWHAAPCAPHGCVHGRIHIDSQTTGALAGVPKLSEDLVCPSQCVRRCDERVCLIPVQGQISNSFLAMLENGENNYKVCHAEAAAIFMAVALSALHCSQARRHLCACVCPCVRA